jgi:hypothetical protein
VASFIERGEGRGVGVWEGEKRPALNFIDGHQWRSSLREREKGKRGRRRDDRRFLAPWPNRHSRGATSGWSPGARSAGHVEGERRGGACDTPVSLRVFLKSQTKNHHFM